MIKLYYYLFREEEDFDLDDPELLGELVLDDPLLTPLLLVPLLLFILVPLDLVPELLPILLDLPDELILDVLDVPFDLLMVLLLLVEFLMLEVFLLLLVDVLLMLDLVDLLTAPLSLLVEYSLFLPLLDTSLVVEVPRALDMVELFLLLVVEIVPSVRPLFREELITVLWTPLLLTTVPGRLTPTAEVIPTGGQ